MLAFTLPEALWLADEVEDVLVGYPTDHRAALEALAADEVKAARVTLMVDSTDHLDRLETLLGPTGPPLRICLDLDASLRLFGGRLHLGTRRSPLHTPAQIQALARDVVTRRRIGAREPAGRRGDRTPADRSPGLFDDHDEPSGAER